MDHPTLPGRKEKIRSISKRLQSSHYRRGCCVSSGTPSGDIARTEVEHYRAGKQSPNFWSQRSILTQHATSQLSSHFLAHPSNPRGLRATANRPFEICVSCLI